MLYMLYTYIFCIVLLPSDEIRCFLYWVLLHDYNLRRVDHAVIKSGTPKQHWFANGRSMPGVRLPGIAASPARQGENALEK